MLPKISYYRRDIVALVTFVRLLSTVRFQMYLSMPLREKAYLNYLHLFYFSLHYFIKSYLDLQSQMTNLKKFRLNEKFSDIHNLGDNQKMQDMFR